MKRFPRRFVLYLMFLSAPYLVAQTLPIEKIKLFEEKDEVVVKSFLVDNKNFIWFVNNNNLYRFDGSSSQEMGSSLKNWNVKSISKIFLSSQNKIWVAGNNQIGYIDVLHWIFVPLEVQSKDLESSVTFIFESASGNMVFGFNNGSLLFVNEQEMYWNRSIYDKSFQSQTQISVKSAANFNETLWVSTSEGTLLEFYKDEHSIRQTHQLTDDISIEVIVPMTDHLLVEVKDEGLFHWIEGKLEMLEGIAYKKDVHLVCNTPRHMFYIDDQNLNMYGKYKNAQVHREPLSVNLKNLNEAHFNQSNILVANNSGIYNILVRSNGVFHYNPIPENEKNSVRDIYFFKDGSHFFCSYNGNGYTDAQGSRTRLPTHKTNYEILPMSEDSLLLSSEGNFLQIFNRKTKQLTPFTVRTKMSSKKMNDNSFVTALAQDEDYFYTGTYNSLLKVHKKSHEVSEVEIENVDVSFRMNVRDLSVENGVFYLSTRRGFYRLKEQVLEKIYPQNSNEMVHAHEILNDTIWLATQTSGLVGIDAQGNLLAQYTTNEGMTDNLVYSLASAEGNLFAFTGYGFNLYKKGEIIPYYPKNKEDNGEYNHVSVGYDATNNTLYAGGLKGYTKIDLKYRFDEVEPPTFVVTDIVLSNRTNELIPKYNLSYSDNLVIDIPKESNYFRIKFKNEELDINKPHLEYKIPNLFSSWNQIDVSKDIELVGLEKGVHLLQVRYPGSSKIQEFTLIKAAYFYEKWWFYTVVSLVVIGLSIYYFKFRLNRVTANERLRSRIAADLHDDIGSILGGILAQSQYASIEPEKTPQILNRIKENSRIGLQALSDIVWSVDQKNDHWNSFVEKLEIHGKEATNASPLIFYFKVVGELPKKKLSQQIRQNLWLIYKEAIMNCIKHAQATRLHATLEFVSSHKLKMIIHDNGMGYDEHTINPGNGLKNIKMRTHSMGGSCEVDSKSEGTKIRITVPL